MSGNVKGRRGQVIRRSPDGYGIRDLTRVIRADCPNLTGPDHDFLTDVDRGRYNFGTALARLIDLSAQCSTNRGRYALANWITQQIDGRCAQPVLPFDVAKLAEDRAQHDADDADHAVMLVRNPSPSLLHAAYEKAMAHARSAMDYARSLAARAATAERRSLWVLLFVFGMACSDATAPRVDDGSCCAYVNLTGTRGEQFQLWGEFTPCPKDCELEATGWHRAPCPTWWGR